MTTVQLKTSLARPALPVIEARLRWPGTLICVVGQEASRFAGEVIARLREHGAPARGLTVALRHAEGSALEPAAFEGARKEDLVLRANPDALVSALSDAQPGDERALTIGAGLALAAAAKPDLLVWIRAGERPLALSEPERAIVGEAALVLEEPRGAAARALGDALVRTGPVRTGQVRTGHP